MSDLSSYPVIVEFTATIERPKPLVSGVTAKLFGENGQDADAITELGKTQYQDALVHVSVTTDTDSGGFEAYMRRPVGYKGGMVAQFFGENGEAADMITALGLSKFLDKQAEVVVRMIQEPSGRDVAKKPKGPYSSQAQALARCGFFRQEAVWRTTGSDAEYLAWLKQQPCCINAKRFGSHEGDIVPMHVRRIANGAGEGLKPEYSAIPGCNKHHTMQHQGGESEVGGRDYYDKQRLKFLAKWSWTRFVSQHGYGSMTEVPPSVLFEWAAARGLENLLPVEYRQAEAPQSDAMDTPVRDTPF